VGTTFLYINNSATYLIIPGKQTW